jgi:hypothetical protein
MTAQAIEAGTAATAQTDAVHESAVGLPMRPVKTYKDYLPYRPGFPLPFADREPKLLARKKAA